ncbi:MAG TPA: hypothetical protein VFZ65_23880 [Planctomycetota bacterium]|nr:hypothetical protein [Planctomycetota bacterium]
MTRLFLYHNGRRGEVLLCRALYRSVLATGVELVLGACRDDGELLAGLGPRCQVVEGPFRNTAHGAPLDLDALCPPGLLRLEVGFGGSGAEPTCQWPDVVGSFERDCRRLGIELAWADPEQAVPMLDFAAAAPAVSLRRPSIYLDNARTACAHCWFVYDVERLARALPDWDLLCTAPAPALPSVVDISHWSWSQRSRASEACEALVGTTLDPFVCTLTEANRWKCKALCGYDARLHAPFWDYPGNPMELLATMDELVDFLLANVAERSRR